MQLHVFLVVQQLVLVNKRGSLQTEYLSTFCAGSVTESVSRIMKTLNWQLHWLSRQTGQAAMAAPQSYQQPYVVWLLKQYNIISLSETILSLAVSSGELQ